MKVRIQRSNAGRDWHDVFDAEVTERGAQTIRVKVPGLFGYIETFWAVGKKAGEQWNNNRSLRVHPEDVPALASLPVRVRKTKPVDLNAHPMADVLREVVQDAATIRVGGEGVGGIVSEIIDDGYAIGLECKEADHLKRIAALALAGLVALAAQKGGT